ncbi:alpha-soluble NSF attachment protein-like [Chironomus tepperi]|uniref:alpha-soluble NSF attachment protein-like n=1 Tax=Chironomus tepperi TaxID=113505 RepID=UPI00391F0ABB
MADNEQKALQAIAEAKEKLNSSKGLFGLFGNGGNKVEEAIECYCRAGNMFKIAKKWQQAGSAFCEAAKLHEKTRSYHDIATNFVEASNCYKQVDPNEAVSCLLKAIDIYTEKGNLTMAARQHQSIAEIFENEANDLHRAVQHYEKAADYFKCQESSSSANECMIKVAQYAAQSEDYDKAITIYESVAASYLGSAAKHSAKEIFFRASLCHLNVDSLNAHHALNKYVQQYPVFQDSREFKFVKTLLEHLEELNIDGYTAAVKDYDRISRLDQWSKTMLSRIKKQNDDDLDLR